MLQIIAWIIELKTRNLRLTKGSNKSLRHLQGQPVIPDLQHFYNIHFLLLYFSFCLAFWYYPTLLLTILPCLFICLYSCFQNNTTSIQSEASKLRDFLRWVCISQGREQKHSRIEFCTPCHSCRIWCGRQQDHDIKNASFLNDGPQRRGMKGYFELSLKMMNSGTAFDTRNQH